MLRSFPPHPAAPLSDGFHFRRVLLLGPDSPTLRRARDEFARSGVAVTWRNATSGVARSLERRPDVAAVILAGCTRRALESCREALARCAAHLPWIVVQERDAAVEAFAHHDAAFQITPPVLTEDVRAIARTAHLTRLQHRLLRASLARGIESARLAVQPIIALPGRGLFAHEGLLRTDEPAWSNPMEFLAAAEKSGRALALGRQVRTLACELLAHWPAQRTLFLNLGVADVLDEALYDPCGPLAAQASRVVLELAEHDRTFAIPDLPARVRRLRRLGFRIALDDLDAGHHGLGMLAKLAPDFVKVDRSLITDLQDDPGRQRVLVSILRCAEWFSSTVICEGVETAPEETVLARLGVPLAQGYLFGRPSPP